METRVVIGVILLTIDKDRQLQVVEVELVAIEEPGGKRNLVRNIKAQHTILNKPIIIQT